MEIEFRVWDPIRRCMFEGYDFGDYMEFEGIVMLNIGLKDSDGNKIYLHDIVECIGIEGEDENKKKYFFKNIYLIGYFAHYGYPGFDLKCGERDGFPMSEGVYQETETNCIQYFLETPRCSLKVIGNKFENPELLK